MVSDTAKLILLYHHLYQELKGVCDVTSLFAVFFFRQIFVTSQETITGRKWESLERDCPTTEAQRVLNKTVSFFSFACHV